MTKNKLLSIFSNSTIHSPGDEMSARITSTNRQVLKISKNNGRSKYSATRYPNGTVVETKTIRPN